MDVVKRDGSIEPYNPSKIERVVIAAGLDPQKSQELIFFVTDGLKKLNTPKVTSLQIRDLVILKLKELDANAANLFIWYEQTKEKKA